MTAIAACRIPGLGCVMAADGRMTSEALTIEADDDQKLHRRGDLLIGTAGAAPAIFLCQADSMATLAAHNFGSLEVWWLVYSRTHDMLWCWTHEGPQHSADIMTGGSGADFAKAALDGAKPKTLEAARELVRRAVALACKYQAQCGGKIRTKSLKCAR